MPVSYWWTWSLDGIVLSEEDVDTIPFEIVSSKVRRPEDRGKKAPQGA